MPNPMQDGPKIFRWHLEKDPERTHENYSLECQEITRDIQAVDCD